MLYNHDLFVYIDKNRNKKIYYKTLLNFDFKEMYSFLIECKEIKRRYKNKDFAFHSLMLESKDINIIPEYDPYFKGAKFYSDKILFEKELLKDEF